MSQTVTGNPYNMWQPQAFVGMKADSTDVANVDTFACGTTPIPFGVVVSRTAAAALTVVPGGATNVVGISLHDHLVGSRGSFTQYDAVNVINRGRVWASVLATAGIADGVAVTYDTATGKVSAGGANALTGAVFRSAAITLPDGTYAWEGGTMTALGAVVEFNWPIH